MKSQDALIQQATDVVKSELSYKHYSNFTYDDLWSGHNSDTDYFISREGLTFKNYVSYKYLTGNELLYYPELTQEMRTLKEYPLLTRKFEVDKEIEGLAFVDYFCNYVRECYEIFEKDLLHASQIVNRLILLYGAKRTLPTVDKLIEEKVTDYRTERQLVVNGVTWKFDNKYSYNWNDVPITDALDLHRLLKIPYDFCRVSLEDATVGTPFIAVRLAKTWRHKGHVYWYNLDTLTRISKADRAKWKKP